MCATCGCGADEAVITLAGHHHPFQGLGSEPVAGTRNQTKETDGVSDEPRCQ